ncbi:hypothetical protein BH23GEM6_BH23GEM6_26630 [soil metagenome]
MDADRGIEDEAAVGLPREHVLDGVLVEECATPQRALEALHVVGREVRRPVEGDGAVVALGEDAVEDDEVEVEVGIEGGAEAVQEGDGAELGVAGSGRAGAQERGADAAKQDAAHIAGEARVVGQDGADPLRQREHPLADGQRRQDMVGEVDGHLHHAARVAGGTGAAALAGEGHQPLGVAADAGEAVGEDAAAEVGAEVVLDPVWHALAVGPRRCRRVREGAAGRGPAGPGRRGRGHDPDGAAVAGAVEWRGGSTPCLGLPPKKPAAERLRGVAVAHLAAVAGRVSLEPGASEAYPAHRGTSPRSRCGRPRPPTMARSARQKLTMAVGAAGIMVLALGGLGYLRTLTNAERLDDRNLRELARIARGVEGRVNNLPVVMRNLAGEPDFDRRLRGAALIPHLSLDTIGRACRANDGSMPGTSTSFTLDLAAASLCHSGTRGASTACWQQEMQMGAGVMKPQVTSDAGPMRPGSGRGAVAPAVAGAGPARLADRPALPVSVVSPGCAWHQEMRGFGGGAIKWNGGIQPASHILVDGDVRVHRHHRAMNGERR